MNSPTQQGRASSPLGEGLYVRNATGLVRELSFRDATLLSIGYVCFPLGFTFITVVAGVFPGASVALGFLLVALFAIPHLVTYGLFGMSMPRSGGDYVYISRSLHPLLGFVANGWFTVFQLLSTGFIFAFVPTFALPALFQGLAITTGDQGWADTAETVTRPTYQFLIGGSMILAIGVLAAIGLRLLVRVFTWLMVISLAGVAVTIGALIVASHDQFVENFSQYGSVSKVVTDAQDGGFSPVGFSFGASVAAVTFLFGSSGFAHITTYFAGEVRRPAKTLLPAILASAWITSAGFALIALLSQHVFGQDFMNAAQFLAGAQPDDWPLNSAPFINLFITIAEPHTWLVVVLGVISRPASLLSALPTMLLATRNFFAWSFDRVLPSRLANVSDRTHTPIEATALATLLMLGFLAGFVYAFSEFNTYIAVTSSRPTPFMRW